MAVVFSIRLPEPALRALRKAARTRGVGPTQLARDWLLERLASEGTTARQSGTSYTVRRRPQPELVHDACTRRGVRRLVMFGSAAREDFDPHRSDVDVAVDFLDMPLGMRADALFGLATDLEAAFGRRVDLLEIKAVRNPYILSAIERDGRVLYDAS